MRLAVIPARGGSKRIPRKNIKLFAGKPILAWSINAAIKSECFDEIIVSTDDKEIAGVALEYGAKVPFLRPDNISDDFATTVDVVAHAIEWQQSNDKEFEEICCIYATAPFVTPRDIKNGLKVLQDTSCDYVFSATEYEFPIQRAFRLNANNNVEMFNPKNFNIRSQDLEKAYHDAGQFYWGKAEAWRNKKEFFSSHSTISLLPRYRVQDIDTPDDWHYAEMLFKLL